MENEEDEDEDDKLDHLCTSFFASVAAILFAAAATDLEASATVAVEEN